MPNIVILGTGMAGFGATYQLHAEGITPVVYDETDYHGGHTASFVYDRKFIFDVGPHISFTKDIRIQNLFAESLVCLDAASTSIGVEWEMTKRLIEQQESRPWVSWLNVR